MLETKYSLGGGEYIKFPAEALRDFRTASRAAIHVLLILSRQLDEDPDSVISVEGLMTASGLEREDVEDALYYWKARGVLKESDDLRGTVAAGLEAVLGRPPADYEVRSAADAVAASGLDTALAARVIRLASYREDNGVKTSWICSAVKEIGRLPSPARRIAELERYYSLTAMIRQGFPITRSLTMKEKEIICSWAARRIPLKTIFNAYSVSLPVAKTVSFRHIDKLLEKAVIPRVSDDELGY